MNESLKRFFDHRPLMSSVLFFIIAYLLLWQLLDIIFQFFPTDYNLSITVKHAASMTICIVFYRLVLKSGTPCFSGHRYFHSLFTFGSLGLIMSMGAFLFSAEAPNRSPRGSEIVIFILMNLAIACNEEFFFRGVVLTQLLSKWRHRTHGFAEALTVSSMLFGLRHYINLIDNPDEFIFSNAQVLFTFMAGFYMGALYICSNNIWVCVTIHFLMNVGAGLWALFLSDPSNSATVDMSILSSVGIVSAQLPYVIFAVLMLRFWKRQSDLKKQDET